MVFDVRKQRNGGENAGSIVVTILERVTGGRGAGDRGRGRTGHVLIDSLQIQIHNHYKSTASLSQGLNFSWRLSSVSNILPGRSLLLFFLSSLHSFHIHCTKTLLLPFSCRSRLSPHAHHPYTVNMRHVINL